MQNVLVDVQYEKRLVTAIVIYVTSLFGHTGAVTPFAPPLWTPLLPFNDLTFFSATYFRRSNSSFFPNSEYFFFILIWNTKVVSKIKRSYKDVFKRDKMLNFE